MRTVIYQLFVRHFSNFKRDGVPNGTREQNGCGTFADVNDAALESISQMGITHLWLTGILRHATQTAHPGLPAHPSCVVKGIAGSPYAVVDYFDVDPDLAQEPEKRIEEFSALLARIRRCGMVPMLDFVPNHVSRCYASPGHSELEPGMWDKKDVFFARDNSFYYLDAPQDGDRRVILPGGEFEAERGCGRVTGNNSATWRPSVFDWYETVKLNYGCDYRHGSAEAESLPGILTATNAVPRTWRILDRVLAWWQNLGVGGFRCDMAHMIPLPFWRWEIARARLRDETAFFMAEAYDDPMKLTPGNPLQDLLSAGFDGVYDAPAYRALRDLYEGGRWANDLDALHRPENMLFTGGVRYVENHDEPRLASPLFWGGYGATVARSVMTAQYASSCGPVLFYNGQEVSERAEGPTGFGGDNGRTSIFDYTSLPRLQRWTCNGRYNGEELSAEEIELRQFCATLLRLLQHPALSNGSFYGLNWANHSTPGYGRENGEGTSGHYLYAFLRHSLQAHRTLLIVCNFSPQQDAETSIHIPRNACDWARKNAPHFLFTDLLDPSASPISATTEQLDTTGLPLRVVAGSARILEWMQQ